MKTLTINSVQYQLVLQSYKEWLETLNYSKSVVKNYPNYIQELLHYVETKNTHQLSELTATMVEGFIEHVKLRKNATRGGGLSANHINSIINGINKFLEYLRLTDKHDLHVELARLKENKFTRDVLTQTEVISLFQNLDALFHPINKRDIGILTCFYGAGLRLNETFLLNLEDVSFTTKTIHVKHGKGNKERLVPLTKHFAKLLKDYVKNCRDVLEGVAGCAENAFFIDVHGHRIKKDSYYDILDNMIAKAAIESLAEKRITPHTFRHSIATHLLQMGMDIEDIARFLGHASLDSTMIYTHIVEELKLEEDGEI